MQPSPASRVSTDFLPDLTDRTAVVTGANSGLGLQAAIALAAKGAAVTLACRDSRRGDAALAVLREATGSDRCAVAPLDLGSLASVRRFAAEIGRAHV